MRHSGTRRFDALRRPPPGKRITLRFVHVYMTAAHAGYGSEQVPVGGAAAICERLCRAWGHRQDVRVTLLGPGPEAPDGVEYVRIPLLEESPSALDEWRYAAFCRAFEREITRRVLRAVGPRVVLSHDISEGPSFGALAAANIPTACMVHVDVVEYFARIYLRDAISAPRAARWWRLLGRLPMPDVLRLVFDKQAAAVAHCDAMIVPAPGMADMLAACYPGQGKVHVLPWGSEARDAGPSEVSAARARLAAAWNLSDGEQVLLTLSRISPEKGQDVLLRAVAEGEARGEAPAGLRVVICGAPAYMQGASFARRLRALASTLATPVVFAGHLGGAEKQAALSLGTVFVSASRHESYGLTTMEAMRASLPVVALRTHGAEATLDERSGVLVPPGTRVEGRLWDALRDLLRDPSRRAALVEGARERAAAVPFARAADDLLKILSDAARPASRIPAAP